MKPAAIRVELKARPKPATAGATPTGPAAAAAALSRTPSSGSASGGSGSGGDGESDDAKMAHSPERHPSLAPLVTASPSSASSSIAYATLFGFAEAKSELPKALFLRSLAPSCNLYPLQNYTFGQKPPLTEKDPNPRVKFERMQAAYEAEGMRRTVEGILLVHNHGHPHILLLQTPNAVFRLPGGRLRPGEEEAVGLKRKLSHKLASLIKEKEPEWEVGELIATWWRPNFDPLQYPYIPPHIAKPKECRKFFLAYLPEKCCFAVPNNYKLLAVPLFELYDNVARYGPQISSIPQALSRFNFACL